MGTTAPDGQVDLVLYDGVCGLCDRFVQFVLRRDARGAFRFAALQGEAARAILARHGRDAARLDTVAVVRGAGTAQEALLVKSDAVLHVLRRLGGAWGVVAWSRVVPRALRDVAYDLVARVRYRVFGRYDACKLPTPEQRARFVSDATSARAP